jgi:hypothetical protein
MPLLSHNDSEKQENECGTKPPKNTVFLEKNFQKFRKKNRKTVAVLYLCRLILSEKPGFQMFLSIVAQKNRTRFKIVFRAGISSLKPFKSYGIAAVTFSRLRDSKRISWKE